MLYSKRSSSMLFIASEFQKFSYSDWNRRYHQPEHLSNFWQKFKFESFQKKWWKSSKVLKLASFSTLTTLFRLKRTIPTSSSKKNYVSPSQKSTLWLKKMVSVKEATFLPTGIVLFLKNEAIWKIIVEGIFDFLSSTEFIWVSKVRKSLFN